MELWGLGFVVIYRLFERRVFGSLDSRKKDPQDCGGALAVERWLDK